MDKFKIKRRFPNFVTGFEETEHQVTNRDELEKIEWVDDMMKSPDFYMLATDKSDRDDIPHSLMILTHYNEEYGGCKSWWVVGYIIGGDIESLDLPQWQTLIGDHKDGCPQKSWQHNECNCGFKTK